MIPRQASRRLPSLQSRVTDSAAPRAGGRVADHPDRYGRAEPGWRCIGRASAGARIGVTCWRSITSMARPPSSCAPRPGRRHHACGLATRSTPSCMRSCPACRAPNSARCCWPVPRGRHEPWTCPPAPSSKASGCPWSRPCAPDTWIARPPRRWPATIATPASPAWSCGSTGEGNLLSLPEKIDMIEAIRTDPHALPLVFGAGGGHARRGGGHPPPGQAEPAGYPCRRRTTCARRNKASCGLPPDRLGHRTPRHPVQHPQARGVAMTVETMETLAALPQFGSVKECNPLLSALNARGRMDVLCGEDMAFLDHFQMGGRGAFPPRRTCIPSATSRSAGGARRPRRSSARVRTLRGLIRLLFAEPNPAPIKRALALQGLITDELRPPMTSASRELSARLQRAMSVVQCSPSRLQTA